MTTMITKILRGLRPLVIFVMVRRQRGFELGVSGCFNQVALPRAE
jgi:hypothetical protein